MASWMVHLRIADELLPHLINIDKIAFVRESVKWIREQIAAAGL